MASAVFPQAENSAQNYAAATGDYNDAVTSTDDDTASVFIEDVSIHKTVSDPKFVQGDTPFFTLTIESSEYTTSTGPITVTDTLPASLDLTGATPAPTSGPVLDADGSHTYTWVRPAFTGASSTDTIVINTLVREFYRDGVTGLDSTEPVSANQSYTNTTDLVTDATIITDNDGTETTQSVVDESSASQSSDGPTILKEVSEPTAGPFTCGDGSAALPTYDDDFASSYRPGDRVCFRLNVDFPGNLDTNDTVVQDFLPAGFAYESFRTAAPTPSPRPPASSSTPARRRCSAGRFPTRSTRGRKFQVVISTIVSDPRRRRRRRRPREPPEDALDRRRHGSVPAPRRRPRRMVRSRGGPHQGRRHRQHGRPVPGRSGRRRHRGAERHRPLPDRPRQQRHRTALDVSVRDVLPPGITCADVDPLGPSISNGGACDGANDWIQWDPADDIDLAANGGTASLTYDVRVPVGTSRPDTSLVNRGGRPRVHRRDQHRHAVHLRAEQQHRSDADPATPTRPDDPSEIVTAVPTIDKRRDTSIDQATEGNGNNQATIGETISYDVTVTLPDNLTYYDAVITDVVDAEKDLDVTSVDRARSTVPRSRSDSRSLPTTGRTRSPSTSPRPTRSPTDPTR